MKILITESQLKRLINEVGGYDDPNIMNIHAGTLQQTLLQSLASTVNLLNSFLEFSSKGILKMEHLKHFISNLIPKINDDIDLINQLSGEIYLDEDFKNMVNNYKRSLKSLERYLRLLYSDEYGLVFDMTENQIIQSMLERIENLSEDVNKLTSMFRSVQSRYRSRLGLN